MVSWKTEVHIWMHFPQVLKEDTRIQTEPISSGNYAALLLLGMLGHHGDGCHISLLLQILV